MLRNNPELPSKLQPEIAAKKETVAADLIQAYRDFSTHFSVEPQVVYYPSSSFDASPSIAFPDSHVIYVEIDPEAVEVLKSNQRDAIEASALTYILPEKADLLILLNPFIKAKMPVRQVKLGGYVLCNNYHSTATELSELSDFALVGMIEMRSDNQEKIIDQEEAQRLWAEGAGQKNVDNFFIFKRIKPVAQTDEESLAEYAQEQMQNNEKYEEFMRQRSGGSVDLDDI